MLPNVPTISETGPGFVTFFWMGFVAPPGTSPAIEKVSAAVSEALKESDVILPCYPRPRKLMRPILSTNDRAKCYSAAVICWA